MTLILLQSLTLKKMFFNIFMASMMQVQQVHQIPAKTQETKPAKTGVKLQKPEPACEPSTWPYGKIEPGHIRNSLF